MTKLLSGPFRKTSDYGLRKDPFTGRNRLHRGIDFAAPRGTPVNAISEGEVVFAGKQGGYGNMVEVAINNNMKMLFAHLSSISVKAGERVSLGQKIGGVGKTGRSTGYHLHFAVKDAANNYINPQKLFDYLEKQRQLINSLSW